MCFQKLFGNLLCCGRIFRSKSDEELLVRTFTLTLMIWFEGIWMRRCDARCSACETDTILCLFLLLSYFLLIFRYLNHAEKCQTWFSMNIAVKYEYKCKHILYINVRVRELIWESAMNFIKFKSVDESDFLFYSIQGH